MLKPQDIMTLGWLALQGSQPWRYADLAMALGLSASESHASVKRLESAGLVRPASYGLLGDLLPWVNEKPALEFLLHGVPYVFYAERGPVSRGMPTGVAAPPLAQEFNLDSEIPVWPDAEGMERGYALKPLYKSAPVAARNNPKMYEYLALVDALRDGRSRERKAAGKHLEKFFHG